MDVRELKEEICDICHSMWQQGWVAANDGNVSARVGDGTFLATPTGVSKRRVTPDMLVRIDAQGRVVEAEGKWRPSSEMKMHLRCYEVRDDVHGVVHAHPPTATAFAVAGKSLDDYSMIETVISLGSVPVAPYGTPSTDEVPDSITPFLPIHDAMLLAHHGALTVGADVTTAYYRMESLELYAKIALNAHLLGGTREIPRDKIDELLDVRAKTYGTSGRHPGYRKYNG